MENKEKKKEGGTMEKKPGKDNGQCRDTGAVEVFTDGGANSKAGKLSDTAVETTRAEGQEEPIVRRSALARTPPLKRTHSLPDEGRGRIPFSWEVKTPSRNEVDKDKRKRGEESPTEASAKESLHKRQKEEKKQWKPEDAVLDLTWDEDEARSARKKKAMVHETPNVETKRLEGDEALACKIRKTIKNIDREVCAVAEVAKERNTKKEIKEGTQILISLLSTMMSGEVQEFLQTLGKSAPIRHSGTVVTQKENDLAERLETVETRLKGLEERNKALSEENTRLRLELDNTQDRKGDDAKNRQSGKGTKGFKGQQ